MEDRNPVEGNTFVQVGAIDRVRVLDRADQAVVLVVAGGTLALGDVMATSYPEDDIVEAVVVGPDIAYSVDEDPGVDAIIVC